ncbi:unnamed protein product [Cylindrotheca closterium]|uniref:DNA mismatch repair protein PMS1 n=1 Tax=Cylindrotheca closterium TaxID=2856 RepID=A0AAD2G2X4_9STRA|nr:unnamed protein product [Cylindrotheca closterium]
MEEDDDTAEIKKLHDDSIRRIVAEQAITDLSSIVKELVDNSIDAESKTIKVRLFGHGLEIIEVSDDGFGVPLQSREHLATRYATSKINCFDDIYSGTGLSMGFRGEALFSMACLSSQLIVASRTESEGIAQKMQFQRDGSLDKSSVTAVHRKIGTTVAVLKPFAHLPARRADMARRIRTERSKLFRLMESYAIFNVGVGINLIDMISGREDVALATSSASTTLEENVSAVLGHKFLSSLANIDVKLGDIVAPNKEDNLHDWGIKGLLSRNPHADPPARSINTFCINGRVVQLPKFAALLRKLWTGFSGRKRPSCILSLTLPNCSFDINLSPDKQQVLLVNEQQILDVLHHAVTDFYSSQVNGKFHAKRLQHPGNEDVVEKERQKHKRRFAFVHDLSKAKLQHDLEDRNSSKRQKIGHQDEMSSQKNLVDTSQGDVPQRYEMGLVSIDYAQISRRDRNEEKAEMKDQEHQKLYDAAVGSEQPQFFSKRGEKTSEGSRPIAVLTGRIKSTGASVRSEGKMSLDDRTASHSNCRSSEAQGAEFDMNKFRASRQKSGVTDYERQKWTEIQSKFRADQNRLDIKAMSSQFNVPSDSCCEDSRFSDSSDRPCLREFGNASPPSILMRCPEQQTKTDTCEKQLSPDCRKQRGSCGKKGSSSKKKDSTIGQTSSPQNGKTIMCHVGAQAQEGNCSVAIANDHNSAMPIRESSSSVAIANDQNSAMPIRESSTSLDWTSFEDADGICIKVRDEGIRLKKRRKDACKMSGQTSEDSKTEGHQHQIGKRGISESLEGDILSLSKAKFGDGSMEIVGQFNLGFILCLCNEDNLWIFDQHACDEKYNFEKLRRETKISEQRLLRPMALELTSSEEACILDHMNVFEANGFQFEFRPKAPIRRRLLLTSLPHSGAPNGRKDVQFGHEDVKALCAMLSEGAAYDAGDGGTGADGSGKFGNNAVRFASMTSSKQDPASSLIARLPKAISMFASRSCRSSIMIGTALSQSEMKKIVSRLADVEFPWNCPHGRPTLRHVGNVSTVLSEDAGRAMDHMGLAVTQVVINQRYETRI